MNLIIKINEKDLIVHESWYLLIVNYNPDFVYLYSFIIKF